MMHTLPYLLPLLHHYYSITNTTPYIKPKYGNNHSGMYTMVCIDPDIYDENKFISFGSKARVKLIQTERISKSNKQSLLLKILTHLS